MNDESIFVQIASYRDPELVPTILDLFENANNPENLNVCVCWQHDDIENLDILKSNSNIQIIDVPYEKSKGACWARNLIQKYYNGERYTLQLDSHHRFVQGWDTLLKDMYQQCRNMGSEKPLITSYIPAFDPLEPKEKYEMVPWKIDFNKFTEEGTLIFSPNVIKNHESFEAPVPARFYSAHFAFTDGIFCEEVAHDPEYYFYGEEISIGVRAFTKGYDLYHPHKVVAWHEYTRNARIKHWDDHDLTKKLSNGFEKSWWERDQVSHKRNRVLFELDQDDTIYIPTKYRMGTSRTIADYERYAGVRFKTKEVSVYTLSGKIAPTPVSENYVDGTNPDPAEIKTISKNIKVESKFVNESVSTIKFEVHDSKNRAILSKTFDRSLIKFFKSDLTEYSITVNFDVLNEDTYTCKITFYDVFDRIINVINSNL